LAGYLLERFGHLPQPGDSCELKQEHSTLRFRVLRLDGRRIASVQIERLYPQADDNQDENV
jgi:CBS domain containing-hemolysin-like protein